jgi:hypothetical protein
VWSTQRATRALLLAASLVAGAARAQAPPPDIGAAPPVPPLEPSVRAALDAERLAAVLATSAADSHRARMAGGFSLLTLGAAFIPVGAVAESSWNEALGIALWSNGIILVTTGMTMLILPNEIENLAGVLLSQRQIPEVWLPRAERALTAAAAKAESTRTWSGTFNVAIGVTAVGLGAVGMAIATNSTDRGWAASSVVFGAMLLGMGIDELFFPSAAERALALYREGGMPPLPPPQLSFGAAPLPGGGLVAVGGRF